MTEALTIDIEQLGLPIERRPVALLVSLEPQDPHSFSKKSHNRFVTDLIESFRRTPGQWKRAAGADNPKEYLEQNGMLIPRRPFPKRGIESTMNIMDEWHRLCVTESGSSEDFDPDSHAGILLGYALTEAGLRMAEDQVVQGQAPDLVKTGAIEKLQEAADWAREQAEAILEPRVGQRQSHKLPKKLLSPAVVGLTTLTMGLAVDKAFGFSDDNAVIDSNPRIVQTDDVQEAAQTVALKAVRSIFDQLPTSINIHTEQYSSYPAAATVALGVSSEDSAGPIKPKDKVLDELELVGVDVHKIGNGNHTVSLGRTTENFVQSLEESINPVFANEANSLLSQIRHHELLERIDPDFNYYTDVLLHDSATFYVPEDADDEAVFILEAGIELPTAEESTKVKRLREKLGIEQKEDGTQYFQIALYEKDGRMEIGNFTITVNSHGDLVVRNKYEREVRMVAAAGKWLANGAKQIASLPRIIRDRFGNIRDGGDAANIEPGVDDGPDESPPQQGGGDNPYDNQIGPVTPEPLAQAMEESGGDTALLTEGEFSPSQQGLAPVVLVVPGTYSNEMIEELNQIVAADPAINQWVNSLQNGIVQLGINGAKIELQATDGTISFVIVVDPDAENPQLPPNTIGLLPLSNQLTGGMDVVPVPGACDSCTIQHLNPNWAIPDNADGLTIADALRIMGYDVESNSIVPVQVDQNGKLIAILLNTSVSTDNPWGVRWEIVSTNKQRNILAKIVPIEGEGAGETASDYSYQEGDQISVEGANLVIQRGDETWEFPTRSLSIAGLQRGVVDNGKETPGNERYTVTGYVLETGREKMILTSRNNEELEVDATLIRLLTRDAQGKFVVLKTLSPVIGQVGSTTNGSSFRVIMLTDVVDGFDTAQEIQLGFSTPFTPDGYLEAYREAYGECDDSCEIGWALMNEYGDSAQNMYDILSGRKQNDGSEIVVSFVSGVAFNE